MLRYTNPSICRHHHGARGRVLSAFESIGTPFSDDSNFTSPLIGCSEVCDGDRRFGRCQWALVNTKGTVAKNKKSIRTSESPKLNSNKPAVTSASTQAHPPQQRALAKLSC